MSLEQLFRLKDQLNKKEITPIIIRYIIELDSINNNCTLSNENYNTMAICRTRNHFLREKNYKL